MLLFWDVEIHLGRYFSSLSAGCKGGAELLPSGSAFELTEKESMTTGMLKKVKASIFEF
jgi:hypothetical protein